MENKETTRSVRANLHLQLQNSEPAAVYRFDEFRKSPALFFKRRQITATGQAHLVLDRLVVVNLLLEGLKEYYYLDAIWVFCYFSFFSFFFFFFLFFFGFCHSLLLVPNFWRLWMPIWNKLTWRMMMMTMTTTTVTISRIKLGLDNWINMRGILWTHGGHRN